MYVAHFEYVKEEPMKMYFSAKERIPVRMEFEAPEVKTIVFKISKDMKLEVS